MDDLVGYYHLQEFQYSWTAISLSLVKFLEVKQPVYLLNHFDPDLTENHRHFDVDLSLFWPKMNNDSTLWKSVNLKLGESSLIVSLTSKWTCFAGDWGIDKKNRIKSRLIW